MSMTTDCVYGYGFTVYASDEQLRSFILKHKDAVAKLYLGREILEYLDNSTPDAFNPKEEFYDYAPRYGTGCGFYGLIADVMNQETEIGWSFFEGQEDDDDSIMLSQTNPWHYTEKEKSLTEEEAEKICKEYIEDLGGQLKPDYVKMEYFG